MPVMIDELEIVDRHVMKALHHQHNHLAKLDQRSYVALSNFPVTLDSVGSVSIELSRNWGIFVKFKM